jgi:methyl-accepting chemotaxis protein
LSGGKVTKTKTLDQLTVDERLASLEQRVTAYQERIAKYDSMGLHLSKIEASVIAVQTESKHRLEELAKKIDHHNQAISSNTDLIRKVFQALSDMKSRSEVLARVQEKKLDELKAALSNLEQENLDLGFKMNVHRKTTVSRDEIEETGREIRQMCDKLQSAITKQASDSEYLKASLLGTIRDSTKDFLKQADWEASKQGLNSHIDQVASASASALDSLHGSVNASLKGLSDTVSELWSQKMAVPADSRVSTEVLDKLAAACLDASNADIRSRNADKKIELLNRQMENLGLTVKQFQLG